MKHWSRRAAALTSSVTAALILFMVALTALLAYRAFDASRAQRRLSEDTLRDYASFAAFQIKTATAPPLTGQFRVVFEDVLRSSITRGPTPPLGMDDLVASVEPRREMCRCLDSVAFYYRVSFADSSVVSTSSPLATPENLRHLRDAVMAPAVLAPRRDIPVPTAMRGAAVGTIVGPQQFFTPVFSSLNGRPYVFAHALILGGDNKPVIAYGYAAPAEVIVGRAVRLVLGNQPVLPRTLIRGMAVDSILGIRITDASGGVVYATHPEYDARYAATDSIESRLGGLHFTIAIDPAAAGKLVIGGLPRTRLAEVLATTFVAVILLVLLMYQFRRQEALGRLRDDFVSGVSHELRTPLAQIRLLAELLRMGKVPVEDRDRSLRIIDQEARRLSFLVDSILSFTPSQSAQLTIVSTDIANEVAEIVSTFAPLAEAQSVRLETHLEQGLMAEVDRGALRQVLLNLLDNAVRYGPAGQCVTITTASSTDAWNIEVADEGPGIPANERDRIFSPYYRMQRDAGGAVGGTGIGLSVVRRIVEQHGGEVRVSAGEGGPGARFVVTLPIAAARVGA